jgi:molybdate transport system permease protein
MASPLLLSLEVATVATALAVAPGLLVARWLGVGKPFRGKTLVETLFTLPLVLPPTVVGYVLLLLLGRGNPVGEFVQDRLGLNLLFTLPGAAVAASVMAFPLFVRAAAVAFASVDPELLEVGRTLGATEGQLFARVLVPLAYRGLLAALVLAFARALGEFGATLMVAGSIPGETETLPLALYAAVQGGRDAEALAHALLLAAVAFVLLGVVSLLTGQIAARRGER